jgi:hypothetical protein
VDSGSGSESDSESSPREQGSPVRKHQKLDEAVKQVRESEEEDEDVDEGSLSIIPQPEDDAFGQRQDGVVQEDQEEA